MRNECSLYLSVELGWQPIPPSKLCSRHWAPFQGPKTWQPAVTTGAKTNRPGAENKNILNANQLTSWCRSVQCQLNANQEQLQSLQNPDAALSHFSPDRDWVWVCQAADKRASSVQKRACHDAKLLSFGPGWTRRCVRACRL